MLAVATIVVSGAACGEASQRSAPPSSVDLEGEAVARVGAESIAGTTIRRIAAAQAVPLEEARRRAIRDALFAEEARARGVDARALEANVLARSLFDDLRREAAGPVTDDELEEVTRRHWRELRRPEGVRVVHALVHRPRGGPPRPPTEADLAVMREVAGDVHAAVSPAADAARRGGDGHHGAITSFRQLASGVDPRGFELTVEALDPFTAEGALMGASGGSLVPEFVEATWPLREPGAITAPFATSFGVHVAMVLERTPPREVPIEERRALVAPEVLDDRIRRRRADLLEPARLSVELAPNAAALLDLVAVR